MLHHPCARLVAVPGACVALLVIAPLGDREICGMHHRSVHAGPELELGGAEYALVSDDDCEFSPNYPCWVGYGLVRTGPNGERATAGWRTRHPPMPSGLSASLDPPLVCAHFGRAVHAVDAVSLTAFRETMRDRVVHRARSIGGALGAMTVLAAVLGVGIDRRLRRIERLFGSRGERGSHAMYTAYGTLIADGTRLWAERCVCDRAPRGTGGPVLYVGSRRRSHGSPFRDRACTFARLEVFGGTVDDVARWNARCRERSIELMRRLVRYVQVPTALVLVTTLVLAHL